MNQPPKVFLVCAVYNGLAETRAMLNCLKLQTYSNCEAVIVDDGSSDGTEDYIKRLYPNIRLLRGDGNLWWTGAMHWGVEESLAKARTNDFILAMNNDCTFEADFIERLVKLSIQRHRSVVIPLVVDRHDPDQIWDGGVRVDWAGGRFLGLPPARVSQLPADRKSAEVDTFTGRGVLIPVEVFKTIGNYEKQKLPHYLADYEFGLRAKRHGFSLFLTYEIFVSGSIKRTGLGDSMPKQLSYHQLWQLLFSRRSRLNIIDHWRLIQLACPPEHKLRNIGFIVLKIGYLCSHVFPFIFFRPLAYTIKQRFVKPTSLKA